MSNTQTNRTTETVRYANIKALFQLMHQSSELTEQAQLRECRKQVDALLSELMKKEQEEVNRIKQEEDAKNAAKRPQVAVSETVTESLVAEPAVKEDVKPAAKADKPADNMIVSRSKTFTPEKKPAPKVPSYIRGVITPAPNKEPSQNRSVQRTPRQDGFNRTPRPLGGVSNKPVSKIDLPPANKRSFDVKKKEYVKSSDDKKTMSKRTLIRKGFIMQEVDEERMGTRKLKNKKPKEPIVFTPVKIEKAVITTENLTVKILSEKIGKTAQEIIKQLLFLGINTNINSVVDFPTMELVANELGVKLELKLDKSKEEQLEEFHEEPDNEEDLVKRPPIITVMGHVDHGKTSLLDAIRKTSVASGEAGGITQHIGAYSVTVKNEKITFLDTPGHEAFTAMRVRGAAVTDIAVLIVAADDGVMPQTIEAINHAQSAKVPIIVAINKIDKPGAKPEEVKQELTKYGLVCEEWGGDTMMVPISAKTGQGIDKLLENILFVAEYYNFRANPKRKAKCSVIESKLDKGKGPIANIIVTNGTLKVGDYVVCGTSYGKVRAMVDDKGRNVKEADPSMSVSVLGLADVPSVGDMLFAVNDEKMAKEVAEERKTKLQNEKLNEGQKVDIESFMNKFDESKFKEFNVIIKADVQGSVEAIKSSLLKLDTEEVHVRVIHGGVGAINKSDLMLAEVSNALVVGFNVRPDSESKALAESKGIDIRLYKIIYEAIEDIERAIKGLEEPKYREVILGRAQVRNIFKITGVGMVAGSFVLNGKMVRNAKARIYRNGEVIFDGVLATLKRFKDDAKEVAKGYECGINIADFNDYVENDEIEAYELEQIKA
ncbi:MAG: translation initiation factor IF-2 [Clostridia bacterium]|nr:translation initiation factor IF-2 [Clostridia bacterium]